MSSTTSAAPEKAPDESSKLKTFLSILKKFVGVADIASVRFSLPAHLLEPTPNLGRGLDHVYRFEAYIFRLTSDGHNAEYWNYLDRPEAFASIGKSDDKLGRMLEVLRFWFTKDLKYIKGKPCKPYNSTLGEFFRCRWDVQDTDPEISIPSGSNNGGSTAADGGNGEPVKVCYLTEQTSHHPPVSAFYIECPERGVSARGFDQISAKFTGTSVRVAPGEHNLGIFVNIEKRSNEEYQLTHPDAHLGGILRGALSITVADTCCITCPSTRIKTILQYQEDSWIGRAQYKVEGLVFRYDPNNDTAAKIKDVPEGDILARIGGSWHGQIHFTLAGKSDSRLLIDIAPLFPAAKDVPPEEVQLSNESRKFWSGVTEAILDKRYGQATKLKQEIEERQRQRAAERQKNNETWQPRFFTTAVASSGRPELTEEGHRTIKGINSGNYTLEESKKQGA